MQFKIEPSIWLMPLRWFGLNELARRQNRQPSTSASNPSGFRGDLSVRDGTVAARFQAYREAALLSQLIAASRPGDIRLLGDLRPQHILIGRQSRPTVLT